MKLILISLLTLFASNSFGSEDSIFIEECYIFNNVKPQISCDSGECLGQYKYKMRTTRAVVSEKGVVQKVHSYSIQTHTFWGNSEKEILNRVKEFKSEYAVETCGAAP